MSKTAEAEVTPKLQHALLLGKENTTETKITLQNPVRLLGSKNNLDGNQKA